MENSFYGSILFDKCKISNIQKNLNESVGFNNENDSFFISNENESCKNIHIESIILELLKTYRDTYFRYIPKNGKSTLDNIFICCNYIPLVKLEKDQILFHDGNKNGKYFKLKDLLFLIMNNQLLIKNKDINNKETINQGYFCKLHNNNNFQFCKNCNVSICNECTNNHKDHEIIVPEANIKKIDSLKKIISSFLGWFKSKLK